MIEGKRSHVSSTTHTNATVPRSHWKKRLKRAALLLGIGYAFWCTLLFFLQTSMLFPRALPNSLGFSATTPAGFESWTINTTEGDRVEAWFLPGAGRDASHPGPAVMYFHGNAELIDHNQDVARWYAQRGVSVVLVEYRGYGRSGGTPSQKAIATDATAFYDTLAARPEVDRSRIFVHGRSLGGGIAAQLAEDRPTAAIVLNCTFTSVTAMARRYLVPPPLIRSPFRTDDVLRSYNHPVFIAHGSRDDIVPCSHGQRLAQITKHATFLPLDCSHNDFPGETHEKYEAALGTFFTTHGLMD